MAARIAAAVVVVLVLIAGTYFGLSALGLIPGSVTGTLQTSGTTTALSPTFFGVNIRNDATEPANAGTLLAASGITTLRYPGGIIAERTDLSTNTIYSYSGGTSAARFGTASFVQLCESIRCHAIIELPVEIDSPSTAAHEVSYVEGTLGFHPAYWELGNEPAGWPCFGAAWSEWGSGCSGGTNPTQFAEVTLAYAQAIRAVDPAAQFIGLGGTGVGSGSNVEWLTPLETTAGHYLAAVSVHSYVDGTSGGSTLASFFAGLSSRYALPFVLQTAQAAVASACASCHTTVFVTEMNAANGGNQYLGTYYDALFDAAEVTQGLNFGAGSLDLFAWINDGFSFVQSSGSTLPQYTLFADVLSHMRGSLVANATASGASGVYVGTVEGGGAVETLVVNANTASTASVSTSGSGLAPGFPIDLYTWASGDAAPVEKQTTLPASLSLPALSLALVVGVEGSGGGGGFSSSPPAGVPSFFGVSVYYFAAAGLLVMAVLVGIFLPGGLRLLALPLVAVGALFVVLAVLTPGSAPSSAASFFSGW